MSAPDDDTDAALADARTGAMIALVPSAADAARLAVPGGLPADDLHVTLLFLGDAVDWDASDAAVVADIVREQAAELAAVQGRLWAIAAINPTGETPTAAYLVGDETGALAELRQRIAHALDEGGPDVPLQHQPWVPHVSIVYGEADTAALEQAGSQIDLDTVRIAFGTTVTDLPLRPAQATVADAGPAVPPWFEAHDPWLSERMRQVAEIGEAERELGTALEKAVAVYLAAAQARVLRSLPAGRITAAADLDNWPERDTVWRAALEQFVWPVLRALFSRRYRRQLTFTVTIKLNAAAELFLDAVWTRLAKFTEDMFAEVREAQLSGADDAALADMLRIDAPSLARQRQMAALQATIDDPATADGVRREARSRLASLRRANDRAGMRWWPRLAEMARTNALSALNAGSAAGADDEADATGERQYKQWWSTEDTRVRAAHVMAHGQVQPTSEWFSVGGYPMAYPGDPAAPADLTVNCRCSLLVLDAEQARVASADYEAQRGARTDRAGRAIDDNGRLVAAGESGGVAVATHALDPDEAYIPLKPGSGGGLLAEVAARMAPKAPVDPAADVTAAGREIGERQYLRWTGMIAPLDERSPDGRVLASPPEDHSIARTLPLPLQYQEKTAPGHDDSVIVGNINEIWIDPERKAIMGAGHFDLENPIARQVVRQIDRGYHRWVSITHDPDATYTIRYLRGEDEVSEDEVGYVEYNRAFDLEGNPLTVERTAHRFRLSDATLVSIPAFEHAAIHLLWDDQDDEDGAAFAQAEPGRPLRQGEHVQVRGRDAEVVEVLAEAGDVRVRYADDGAVETVAMSAVVPQRRRAEDSGDAVQPQIPDGGFAVEDEPYYEAISAEDRRKAEDDGAAMPGGRYPVRNRADLEKAIQAVGRAGGSDGSESERNTVRRHIIKRAKALGLTNMIPSTWNADGTLKSGDDDKKSIAASAKPGSRAWCEHVAARVPIEPPREWFADPKLTGPTKIVVTDDGRVYGHIAAWNTAHAGRPDVRSAPRARDKGYGKFHRHPVRCADGSKVKTGPLATSGHEDIEEPSVWKVMAHYDNPEFVVADVVVGEDEHGVWCSGALRYGVTPLQVLMTDRYSVSGDWRGGELLAACTASVPGFHLDADETVRALAASADDMAHAIVADAVPRVRIEDGEPVAIIAAGVIPPEVPHGHVAVVKVQFDAEPEDWGRRAFAGWEAAHAEHEADLAKVAEQEQEAAKRTAALSQLRDRITGKAYRRQRELARLAERIGVKVGA